MASPSFPTASSIWTLTFSWRFSAVTPSMTPRRRPNWVGSADLRRLLWARPQLTDAAVEVEERRLDLAEKNIYEALRSNDPRRRDAASMFTIRNSHRARRRGWITTSTSVAELSISASANGPRTITYRWRTEEDDTRDAEAARRERLRDAGKLVVSIGWGDGGSDKTIEHEPNPRPLSED
jgi:hypothetical protein